MRGSPEVGAGRECPQDLASTVGVAMVRTRIAGGRCQEGVLVGFVQPDAAGSTLGRRGTPSGWCLGEGGSLVRRCHQRTPWCCEEARGRRIHTGAGFQHLKSQIRGSVQTRVNESRAEGPFKFKGSTGVFFFTFAIYCQRMLWY